MTTDRIADTEVVTIAGGGLAGALCAIYLARAGFTVEVFERSSDPREHSNDAGRSINLALAERGIAALRKLGLHHRVGQVALPMRGRMIHDDDGLPQMQPYGRLPHEVIYSVHRAELNKTLLNAAEQTRRVRIFFNQELLQIDFDRNRASFRDIQSNRQYERRVFPLIACDGAGSRTRAAIEEYLGFQSDADLLDHAYRELSVSSDQDGLHRMAVDALHIWPRHRYMMIALPNRDGSFTATLFMARHGNPSFANLADAEAAHAFFKKQFPDALEVLSNFRQEWREHPLGILGTVRCPHWFVDHRAVLLGDAAHAIVPFHGQGMNAAFEDCPALVSAISQSDSWQQAFGNFQQARQTDCNAIADMALENYLEMRDSVVDAGYLLRRALERELENRHPNHFVPRYSLVMFRTLPYAQAQQRGRINLAILNQLTADIDTLDQVDYAMAERLIKERLQPLSHEEEE